MNKFGNLSFLMVIVSVISLYVIKAINGNIMIAIIILGILSLLGIVFAVLSKKWVSGILGVLLNLGILVFAFLLMLAWAISG